MYKNAVLENGTPVRIGRFTLELDLTAMTRSMDADVSLVLDDGTVNPCTGGSMGVASPGGGLEPGYTTQFTLPQVIDPNTVTAIQIDGVTMPISCARKTAPQDPREKITPPERPKPFRGSLRISLADRRGPAVKGTGGRPCGRDAGTNGRRNPSTALMGGPPPLGRGGFGECGCGFSWFQMAI